METAKLNRDVLIAIPPMAAALTVAGKAIVMRLTETRKYFLTTYDHN